MKENTMKKFPLLRFPQFNDEWQNKKLGEVAEIITGSTPSTSKLEYYGGNYLFVSPSDINNERWLKNTITKLSYEGYLKGRKVIKNSILFVCIGSTIGKIAQTKYECITNQQINAVFSKSISNDFIYSYLEYKAKKIKTLSAEQAVPIINKTTFSKIPISFPSLPEQEKIANFLSAVDEKIAAMKKKVELLQQFKKGVMQKIFSQELRFKIENEHGELVEAPAWQEKMLGEVGSTYNGLQGKTADDFGKGKHYIQYKQIFDDSKINIKRFGKVQISDAESQSQARFGDVFFTTSSETRLEVGFSSVLLDKIQEVYLNSFCFGFRSNDFNILNPYFARYLFRSFVVRNDITKLGQGSTRYNMSKREFMKIKIHLPSLPEQEKIANFLSAIDDKIENSKQSLSKLELWKKGLLQKMFV